ncbi:HlyD family secretion protein [Lentibacillus persicus]|uniref:HlyD family secretion protein n=1 Tax=Lentibacillus persicus TaxID=640948 RepID=A0A1I1X6C7_9BACI|nr:efflux RND transporter periplasmic adaptor subunit [Lentibacillus persicus]SFE02954.1 HlyD family secretion protein [Lentibacillus persicus]
MKRKVVIAAVVLVVLIAAGFNLAISNAKENHPVEVTTLQEQTISDTVMTSGTLTFAEQQSVFYSPEQGVIDEIMVEEGDEVEIGTVLFRYENEELEFEKKQNDLQIQSLQLQHNDLYEQHRKLDEELEEDDDNEQLQREHDDISLQEKQASLEKEQARLQQEALEEDIADLNVTSQIEGTVLTVHDPAHLNSDQSQQKPLLEIGTLDDLRVETTISQYETMKVQKGQTVIFTSDALPDQSWEGTISAISSLPNQTNQQDSDVVQYPVEIAVEDDMKGLKAGFQIVAEIQTNEYEAKTLPPQAVIREEDAYYTYVVEGGQAMRREVQVGTMTENAMEITDGLRTDDPVIKQPDAQLNDGMDVSVE